jgi:hypothetical protein
MRGMRKRSAFGAEKKKRHAEERNVQADEGNEMLVYEYKLDGTRGSCARGGTGIHEPTVQRLWEHGQEVAQCADACLSFVRVGT